MHRKAARWFQANGWGDLAPALVGRPGATTPYPDKPESTTGNRSGAELARMVKCFLW